MEVVGLKAVTEVLASPDAVVERIWLDTTLRSEAADQITERAIAQSVTVERVGTKRLDRLAGDDRMHQGAVAQCQPPTVMSVEGFAATRSGREWETNILVLDQVHNPANVGMILRTAAGAGVDGVLLPRQGTATMGPIVVKAASGLVFAVPLIDAETTAEALDELRSEGFVAWGLDAGGTPLFDAEVPERVAWVLGNETSGMAADTIDRLDAIVSLPLANGVESLNVAATAAVVSYEIVRRRA